MEHLVFPLAGSPSTAIPIGTVSSEHFCFPEPDLLKFWALLKPQIEAEKVVSHWQSLISPTYTHICTSPSLALPQAESNLGLWPQHPVWNDSFPDDCHVLPFSLSIHVTFFPPDSEILQHQRQRWQHIKEPKLQGKRVYFHLSWDLSFFFFKQDFKIP